MGGSRDRHTSEVNDTSNGLDSSQKELELVMSGLYHLHYQIISWDVAIQNLNDFLTLLFRFFLPPFLPPFFCLFLPSILTKRPTVGKTRVDPNEHIGICWNDLNRPEKVIRSYTNESITTVLNQSNQNSDLEFSDP